MSNHKHSTRIELVLPRTPQQKLIRTPDIDKCAWPSPARIPYPPVLNIRGRDSLRRQSCAQMPGVTQIVLRPPESPMNADRQRVRSPPFRKPQINKLILIPAIRYPHIRFRRRKI